MATDMRVTGDEFTIMGAMCIGKSLLRERSSAELTDTGTVASKAEWALVELLRNPKEMNKYKKHLRT